MNIKGILGPQIMNPIRATEKVERGGIQSDSAHERDPNGQQTFGDDKQDQGSMSDEQIEQAMNHLRGLAGVVEHKWTVSLLVDEAHKKFVLVKDNLGNLIRKIPEKELWSLNLEASQSKGHLLKKSA